MRKVIAACVAGLALLAAAPVLAAQAPPKAPKPEILNYGLDQIRGVGEAPGGAFVLNHPKPKFANRIVLRADFVPELVQSTDRL